ncbi:MAG: hypothetical protein GWO05_16730 [Gammaproteobacteria bacterium]|nr:hypothetical protein [Gammaproteobacteria bacterium]
MEAVRKALHVEMGLLASVAPWVFSASWPMLVLAGLAVAWFWAVKACRPLHRRFRRVLRAGDRRRSRGEFFFVGGVLAAYVLSSGEPAYYCTAVLVLTLADTAAALVGRKFGKHPYGASEARKTLEGSGAFFIVAFVCVAACLAWLSAHPTAPNVAAALAAAVAATLLEAGSRRGADNLLVPIGTVAALRLVLEHESSPVAIALIAGGAVLVAASGLRPQMRGSHV